MSRLPSEQFLPSEWRGNPTPLYVVGVPSKAIVDSQCTKLHSIQPGTIALGSDGQAMDEQVAGQRLETSCSLLLLQMIKSISPTSGLNGLCFGSGAVQVMIHAWDGSKPVSSLAWTSTPTSAMSVLISAMLMVKTFPAFISPFHGLFFMFN